MKLFRFGAPGEERPGVLLPDGARVDASGFGTDWNEAFFGQGDAGLARLAKWVASDAARAPRVPAGTRLASAASSGGASLACRSCRTLRAAATLGVGACEHESGGCPHRGDGN